MDDMKRKLVLHAKSIWIQFSLKQLH